ncbi:MAG TPA: glycerate kinase [Bacillota bacterium]|nr:glycerate kinase [Bacillota bacterium]
MKFIVAPDSFKGTLSQIDVANVMKESIFNKLPTAEVILKPMADGGEGTLDALLTATTLSERITLEITGPIGKKITTNIGIIHHNTVVIEVAAIAGLPLVPESKRHPFHTTTYGVGEAIKYALDQGFKKFIIGLGGSATNDGGLGMLQALGATMRTKKQQQAGIFGKDLLEITNIDLSTLDERIWDTDIVIASDVDQPLYGKNGATYMFGPQKGLKQAELKKVDQAIKNYAGHLERAAQLTHSYTVHRGAGSAGGLGFALLVINGQLISGAKIVSEMINLEEAIASSDVVFTGEGKSDEQTLDGKAPGYVAKIAQAHGVPVILVSGSVSDSHLLDKHFSQIYSLVDDHVSLQQAMNETKDVLSKKMHHILTAKNTS